MMPDAPSGFITRIRLEEVAGADPWKSLSNNGICGRDRTVHLPLSTSS